MAFLYMTAEENMAEAYDRCKEGVRAWRAAGLRGLVHTHTPLRVNAVLRAACAPKAGGETARNKAGDH